MAEVHGPIDILLLEFPASADGATTATALRDLVDGGAVGLYDLALIQKNADGTAIRIELDAGSGRATSAFAAFAGARSGLLGEDDIEEAAKALEPGTRGLVVLYENRWAVPFVTAARSEGAELVASARVTAQEIMEALDAVEAQD
jgi:hypothetical protein